MKSVLTQAFHAKGDVYKSYEYKRVGNSYVKIENSLLKSFHLLHFRDGDRFDVCFGVAPLWQPNLPVDWGEDRLSLFDINNMFWYSKRKLSACGEKAYESVFENIESAILPLLQRCADSKTALIEIESLCSLQHANWEKHLQKAIPHNCRSFLLRTEAYYLALKCREKELLIEMIETLIRIDEENLKRCEAEMHKSDADDIWKHLQNQYLCDINKYTDILRAVQKEDWQFFEPQLNQNAEENLLRFRKQKLLARVSEGQGVKGTVRDH